VLDVADVEGMRALVASAAPEAITHLAGGSITSEADRDPEKALHTHVGGVVAVVEAARLLPTPPAILVVSSAAVYGPSESGGPLAESSALAPRDSYGLLKLAGESVASAAAARSGMRLAVARPFGHVGPGQAPVSAVGAFARRVAAVRRRETDVVSVGNLDVVRDIGDVRDVVRAYRLIVEGLVSGDIGRPVGVFNVATGNGVSLRKVLDLLCRLAGVAPEIRVDADLVRADDPPRVIGDATKLTQALGWRPQRSLEETLRDVLAEQLGPE
jgi:GDP-4-dehydro-6-deoxy-D-mannose reductase